MIMTNKLLPVALVAALIGGSVGAVVMHSRSQTPAAEPQSTVATIPATDAQYQANAAAKDSFVPAEFSSASEQTAYKTGFADGFRACESGASGTQLSSAGAHATSYSSRPQGRSFWQKHRDKLTVAMGTGGGAIIGGLIGGKKGAAIGALGGAGGSALYTYKLRNRNRRY
jgi:phage tail tape-measure protein